jgi:hypothetical protein
MKKVLVVGCLLTVIATPAFAHSFERPVTHSPRVRAYGHSAYARDMSRYAQEISRAKMEPRGQGDNVGIFENLPDGVTDPYAYHDALEAED